MVNSTHAATVTERELAVNPLWVLAAVGGGIALGAGATFAPELTLVGLVGLVLIPLAFVSPILCLCALTFASFLEEYVGISGGFTATKLLGALLILAWIAAAATHARGRSEGGFVTGQPVLSALLVLLAGWASMSIVWAEAPEAAQGAVGRYVLNFLLFPVVFFAVRSPRHVTWIVVTFVAGALLAVGLGLFTGSAEDADRLAGAGLNPNQLGGYLVAAAIFAGTAAANRRWSVLGRTAVLFAAAAAGIGVLMTGSRGALLGLVVALVVAPFVLGRGRRLGAVLLVVAAVLGSVWWYVSFAPETVVQRVTNPSEGGGSGREDLWRVGWRMVEAEPFHGVGAGNFSVSSVHYLLRPGLTDRDEIIVDDKKVAHNIYLTMLSELGVVGLTLYLAILALCLRCAWKAVRAFTRNGDEPMELVARALFISLVSLLAAGFFSSAVYSKQMWLLLALAPALLMVAQRSARLQPASVTSRRRRQSATTRVASPVLRGA
jgi:O-antigen ligase